MAALPKNGPFGDYINGYMQSCIVFLRVLTMIDT